MLQVQKENPIFSAPLPRPESLGLPKDIRILWRTDEKVLFGEIPMNRFISKDVPVDDALLHSLERKMDRETQHRQWNGQLGPGIIAQVIDPVVGVNGDLFLCEGFHRNAVQQKKKAEIFFSELRLGYNYDQMLGLRIVSATGHRSVEMPRIVDWVTQSWNITPWSKKISIFQGFSLVTVPNMTGREMIKKNGLTQTDIDNIRAWVIEHCEDWKKKPQLIMAHLDLARKVSPDLIRMQRIGEKGRSLTPAQTRAIGYVIPWEDNWSLQQIAARIAITQSLNEKTTRKVSMALSDAKNADEIIEVQKTDWKKVQLDTAKRVEPVISSEATDKLFDRIWDLEVDNAKLLADLAINKGIIFSKKEIKAKSKPSPSSDLQEQDGITKIKINRERLNKDAEDALIKAQEGDPALLYHYFEDIVEPTLKRALKNSFKIEEEEFDAFKEFAFERIIKMIESYELQETKLPYYMQLTAKLNTLSLAIAKDFKKSGRKISKEVTAPIAPTKSQERGQDEEPGEEIKDYWNNAEIRKVILNLIPDHCRIIIMNNVLGYSIKDIAQILNKNVEELKKQAFQASLSLQDGLRKIQNPPDPGN